MFYYSHPYLGVSWSNLIRLASKPPTKQGLDSTVKPVVPAVSSCQDHTKTCDTLNRRADLTQRALFGEMYNAVWGSAPYFDAGDDVGTGGEKPLECQVENESWKITKVGKSLGEQYLLKHKRVYSWWFVG